MTLPYDDLGAGPAVVLLHAGVADRRMWAEHLTPIADAGFRVLAMDLPGFGEAPAPALEDAPWVDVLATMDALDVEQAILVGNSFGGAVAQRVAVVAPERVSSLVLVSSLGSGVEPSAEMQAAWEAEETALEDGDIDAAVQTVIETWTLPDAPQELRDAVAAMQRRAFELQTERPPAPEAPDPLEEDPTALSAVEAPVLIVVGEHDMLDFHLAADALAQALPHARREILPGAGHLAPLEQPAAFRELLLSFLG